MPAVVNGKVCQEVFVVLALPSGLTEQPVDPLVCHERVEVAPTKTEAGLAVKD